jgi:hypothetical protein
MSIEFENIETLFNYQLQIILDKTETEIVEVKNKVSELNRELEMLGREADADDEAIYQMAAQFIALANIIKYQVKAELLNRRFELN